jgi:N-acetylglucosaminyl-diphospho-decaprenol L-rhamnosyltransferase
VVVVDNASRDRTPAILAEASEADPNLLVHSMAANLGYAAAVNVAFARTGDRDLMLINPDVQLDRPEPVLALAQMLSSDPGIGVVAPRLLDADGEVQPNARRFPSLMAMVASTGAAERSRFLRRTYQRYTGPSRSEGALVVDWVIGAAMMIRRAAFDEVGGWDERFFLYMEDTDFCRRCARAGWDVVYQPSVTLHHRYPRASRTGSPAATSRARRSHIAGLARLWARDPRLLIGLGGVRREVAPGSGA